MNTGTYRARLVALAGLAFGVAAHGQTLSWNNIAGGSASTAGNWSPAAIPTSANDLVWNLANTFPVTFNATTAASRTHKYRRGVVTVTATSPHTISTGLTVGDLNGDVATMTFTGGTLTSNAPAIIGNAVGSTGTLNVNDDDADLIVGGVGSDMTVGSNGPGTLNITGGGLVSVGNNFIAGNNTTGTSIVTVSGQLAVNPFTRSTLVVNGASQSRLGQGGDATVNISNGALADFAGDLVISNGTNSVSSVTVAGIGLVARATLDVAGDLLMGRNTNAGAAAGTATLNVNNNGSVLVGGTLFVAGDPNGGSGTLHLADGGAVTTHSFLHGNGGTLDLDGGTLDIDGGTFGNTNTSLVFTIGGVNNPVVTLKNGAAGTLSTVVGGRALTVGGGAGNASADFDVSSGSDLNITAGELVIGEGAGDTGSMIVSGTGSTMSLATGEVLIVGLNGNGRCEAELGGTLSGDVVFIANNSGSLGALLLETPTATATFRQIYVGGSNVAPGGAGDLVVTESVLNVTGAGSLIRVWPVPGSGFIISGGVVNAQSALLDLRGQMSFQDNAIVHAASTAVANGGKIVGHPNVAGSATLDSTVLLNGGATLELINGDMTVGRSTSAAGFTGALGSTITIGSHNLTLLDSNIADVGTVSLAGGTLAAPNGIEIVTNGTIDGTGTLACDVLYFTGGSVITATGASGITFTGKLRNNSGFIDGTKFTFTGAGSGWSGAGAINARAVFNSGAEIDALSNMTIGLAVTDGVTFNSGSELHAGNEIVTLVDSNGLTLPTLTDFDGGTVTCTQPMSLASGRSIAGAGTIAGTLNVNAGKLQPGFADGDRTNTLFFNGTLTLSPASEFTCEIAGLVDNDGLWVQGTANLSGTVRAEMINGHVPQLGDNYFIMQIDGSMNGEFTNLIAPRGFHIIYGFSDSHIVSLFYCPPDFDEDGFLTGLDFDLFVAAFENGDSSADYDEDGFVTGLDFDRFVQDFEHGCG